MELSFKKYMEFYKIKSDPFRKMADDLGIDDVEGSVNFGSQLSGLPDGMGKNVMPYELKNVVKDEYGKVVSAKVDPIECDSCKTYFKHGDKFVKTKFKGKTPSFRVGHKGITGLFKQGRKASAPGGGMGGPGDMGGMGGPMGGGMS